MNFNKRTAVALFSTAGLFFAATNAEARCTGFQQQAKLVGDILDIVCNAAGDCPFGNQQAQSGIPTNLLNDWNAIANNGPSKIGPRELTPKTWDHGEVVTPGKRLWIVARGVDGEYTVKIKHKDGDSRMVAELCGVDADGDSRYLGFIEVPKKSSSGKTWTKTVTLNQESLFVDVIPKTLFKKFQYDIWAGRS